MSDLFVQKLLSLSALPEADQHAIRAIPWKSVRPTDTQRRLEQTLDGGHIHQIERGQIYRYRELEDGRRQILGLLITGDFVDMRKYLVPLRSFSIKASPDLVLRAYPASCVLDLAEASPPAAKGLWRTFLSEEAIAQEWLISLGQRSALERLAHLVCELRFRFMAFSGRDEPEFTLRLTQQAIGEAMGLSTVHVNRTLKVLRHKNVMIMKAGRIRVYDFPALEKIAGFSPCYMLLRPVTNRFSV